MDPNEPIKNNLYAAGAVVAAATFFLAVGVAEHITFQVVCLALGGALTEFGAIVFATKRARDVAFGPQTVARERAEFGQQLGEQSAVYEQRLNEVMDADAVIRAAEAEDTDGGRRIPPLPEG